MRVIVYVEGRSDVRALENLLRPLIQEKRRAGIRIQFHETPKGDRKASLLRKAPRRALEILRNQESAQVVLLPDLYPPNTGFPHDTVDQLREGIREQFLEGAAEKPVDGTYLAERLHVFCLKHDLEALVLAAHDQLAARLGVEDLDVTWTEPVEDQNHDKPPKRVVQSLFEEHGVTYQGTVDAPLILGSASYRTIAEHCHQEFAPFVDFLEGLEVE